MSTRDPGCCSTAIVEAEVEVEPSRLPTIEGEVSTREGGVSTSGGQVSPSEILVSASEKEVSTSEEEVSTSEGKVSTREGEVSASASESDAELVGPNVGRGTPASGQLLVGEDSETLLATSLMAFVLTI